MESILFKTNIGSFIGNIRENSNEFLGASCSPSVYYSLSNALPSNTGTLSAQQLIVYQIIVFISLDLIGLSL